jgi:hypothetical protein
VALVLERADGPDGVADLVAREVGDGAVQVGGQLRLLLEHRVAAEDPLDRLAVAVLEVRRRQARELALLCRKNSWTESLDALGELGDGQAHAAPPGISRSRGRKALTDSPTPTARSCASHVSAMKSATAHMTE